jgi:hypothetical protein
MHAREEPTISGNGPPDLLFENEALRTSSENEA